MSEAGREGAGLGQEDDFMICKWLYFGILIIDVINRSKYPSKDNQINQP